jgi:hypothetical protein
MCDALDLHCIRCFSFDCQLINDMLLYCVATSLYKLNDIAFALSILYVSLVEDGE